METLAHTVLQFLRLLLASAVFIAPGFLATRNLTGGVRWIAAFPLSAALLVNVAIALDAMGVQLRVETVGSALIVCAGALYLATKRAASSRDRACDGELPLLRGSDLLWLVPIAIAVGSVTARARIEPLSGYDHVFRWDYLARLIAHTGSLEHYPAVSAADFESYAWCDGIPPLVALLNFWIYVGAGVSNPSLTAIRIVAEMALLGTAVFHYARILWGKSAGWPALATMSASALALWGIAHGQETALLALSLVTMLYFLERHRLESHESWTVWAGVAAASGALARDYGLSLPLLGLGVLLFRIQRRAALRFAVVSLTLCAPWYLRNAILTGNPVYPHSFGGLLPGNPVHEDTMIHFRAALGWTNPTFELGGLIAALLALAGVPLLLGLFGLWRKPAGVVAISAALLLTVALWIWSVPLTAGGWAYSLRVLLPAVALGGVLSGWIGHASQGVRWALLVALSVVTIDAARRSWVLPATPFAPVLPYTWREWRENRDGLLAISRAPVWDSLVRAAENGRIVVDHPAHHAFLARRGGHAVPLFSPVLRETFAEDADYAGTIAKLQAEGIRFITLSTINPFTHQFVAAHPFWRELVRRQTPLQIGALSVYDLKPLPAP